MAISQLKTNNAMNIRTYHVRIGNLRIQAPVIEFCIFYYILAYGLQSIRKYHSHTPIHAHELATRLNCFICPIRVKKNTRIERILCSRARVYPIVIVTLFANNILNVLLLFQEFNDTVLYGEADVSSRTP